MDWFVLLIWLVVWNINFIFPYIGNVIIPTDEFIFLRGVGQPPTRLLLTIINHTITIYLPLLTIYRQYINHHWHISFDCYIRLDQFLAAILIGRSHGVETANQLLIVFIFHGFQLWLRSWLILNVLCLRSVTRSSKLACWTSHQKAPLYPHYPLVKIQTAQEHPRFFYGHVLWPFSIAIGSMYARYGNMYHQYTPNVSIYTIHGSVMG